jgi:hypothetical protein
MTEEEPMPPDTRRRLVIIVTTLVVAAGAPLAGADEGAPPPLLQPCCCCGRDVLVEKPPAPDDLPAIITGVAFITTGVVLPIAHAVASSTGSSRDLIPVVGPMLRALDGRDRPEWAAAMMFAAWAQVVGSLIVAVATSTPPCEADRITVGAGVGPDGGRVTLRVRF